MMFEYKSKYLKYKSKYLELKNNKENKLIKKLTIPDSTIVDIGVLLNIDNALLNAQYNIVNILYKKISTKQLIIEFVEHIKNIIKNNSMEIFYAGRKYWTKTDIANGFNNDGVKLIDVLQSIGPIKLEIEIEDIRPYRISLFYILKSIDGFINIKQEDIEKYLTIREKLGEPDDIVKKIVYDK